MTCFNLVIEMLFFSREEANKGDELAETFQSRNRDAFLFKEK